MTGAFSGVLSILLRMNFETQNVLIIRERCFQIADSEMDVTEFGSWINGVGHVQASISNVQDDSSAPVTGLAQFVRLCRLSQWKHLADFSHDFIGAE